MKNTHVKAGQPDAQFYTNTAGPYASGVWQVGVVHGDANLYQVSRDAPAEEKFQRGVNYLNGRMARQAESLIHEAVREGHITEKVAYHWVLAILSGKSFNHLQREDFPKLRAAFNRIQIPSSDEWSKALEFISRLINYLRSQEKRTKPNHTALTSVLRAYMELNPQHQAEVQRHLEMMLTEAIQGHWDLLEEKKVRDGRMENFRKDRAWKFFQPEPTPPKVRTSQSPQIRAHHWAILVCGALFCLFGVVWEVRLLIQQIPVHGGVVTILLVGSACFAVRLSLDRFALRHRRNMNERERLDFLRDSGVMDSEPSTSKAAKTRFVRQVTSSVAYYFTKYRPKEVTRSEWENETTPTRRELHHQIFKLYFGSDASVSSLNWLIRWHARKAAHELTTRKRTNRGRRRFPQWREILLVTSSIVLVTSALAALAITARVDLAQALSAFALTTLGCGLTLPHASHIYGEKRRQNDDLAEYSAIFRDEQKEYRRWLGRLKDRPTDLEMAQWLDHDKIYIKFWGMNKYGITNRDVIAHVTLMESASRSRRARIISGPYRYSHYHVHVFLLTEGGVRKMSVDLNFLTGELSNVTRTTFRYDAIASAGIVEVEARFNGRRWSLNTIDGQPDPEQRPEVAGPSLSAQALHISLVNGYGFDMVFMAFDENSTDATDNLDELREHSQDASGATDALRILEAVAADGKDWLARERKRRQRYLEYDERQPNRDRSASAGEAQNVTETPKVPTADPGQQVTLRSVNAKSS